MPVAVATRTVIRLRWRARFAWGSVRAAWQARRSPGYLGGSLRVTRGGPVFWTLTLWQDGAAMNAFRESGAHGELMPKMAGWASQVSTTAWKVEKAPSWPEAIEQMALNPRWIEIARPDAWHREKRLQHPSALGLVMPLPRRVTLRKSLERSRQA